MCSSFLFEGFKCQAKYKCNMTFLYLHKSCCKHWDKMVFIFIPSDIVSAKNTTAIKTRKKLQNANQRLNIQYHVNISYEKGKNNPTYSVE